MQLRSLVLAVVTAAVTLARLAGTASACSPATFDTPYDLFDQATTVVLVKVDAVNRKGIEVTRVEALKGRPAATLSIEVGLGSSCSPAVKKGATGVVYLDAAGHMLGLYNGFQRSKVVIAALQKRRKFEDGARLASILAGRSDAVSDAGALADTIAATATSFADKVAAMERCEQIRGRSLARFTDYTVEDSNDTESWKARADACRSGTPVP